MILLAYGTRPEYIKIKPLLAKMEEYKISFKTLFTGQHENIVNKDANYTIQMKNYGHNRLDNIIQNCLNLSDKFFDKINYLLVQGDTSSAVGLAFASYHKKIKLIHLEAGLRTYDKNNPFPEEINRRIISVLADIHLCPTKENKENLIKENISSNKIYVVGNTILDNLVSIKNLVSYENKILITLHRRENHKLIKHWFIAINNLSLKYSNYEFICPLHPNPNVQKYKKLLFNVNIVKPLLHEDLLDLLLKTKLVITDSGGLQEECSFLNKKCLVCRKITERPEAIGTSSFMVNHPNKLKSIFDIHIKNHEINVKCPYGNGNSCEKICKIFIKLIT